MKDLRFQKILLINSLLWLSVPVICLFIRPVFRDMTGIYMLFCLAPLCLIFILLLFARIYQAAPPKHIRSIIISLNVFLIIFMMWISKPLWEFYSLLNFTLFMIVFYFITNFYKLSFREVLLFGTVFQISLLLYFPVFSFISLITINSLTIIYYILQNIIFFLFFACIAVIAHFSEKGSLKKADSNELITSRARDKQEKSGENFYQKIIDIYLSGIEKQKSDLIYQKIKEILEETGRYCHADRAYLFELNSRRTHMDNTVEWCIDPVQSQQTYLQNIPISDYPWWINKLNNKEYVFIKSVQELPPEAIHEKQSLEMQLILSLIVIGIYSNGILSGFIGIDYINPLNKAQLKYIRYLNHAGRLINELLNQKNYTFNIFSTMNSSYSDRITPGIILRNVDRMLNDTPCVLVSHSFDLIGMNTKGKELFGSADKQHKSQSMDKLNFFSESERSILIDSLKSVIESNIQQGLIPEVILEKNNAFYSIYYLKIFFQNEKPAILMTFIDVTLRHTTRMELIKQVEEKKRMLSEIHHRVKNNMQIISNFMDLENLKINTGNALSIFNDTRDRIKALAILHEKLYESREFGRTNLCIYLKELAENIILVLSNNKNIELNYFFKDDIIAGFDMAVTCGLLVNEIIVNSIKHAFTDRGNGCISLEISKDQNDIVMIIGDDGYGFDTLDKTAKKTTLGLRLIDGFIRELNGSYELSTDNGTQFRIRFPDTFKEG